MTWDNWRDWNYGLDTSTFEMGEPKDGRTAEQIEQGWFNEDLNDRWDDINMAYLEVVRERRRWRAELEDQRLFGVR